MLLLSAPLVQADQVAGEAQITPEPGEKLVVRRQELNSIIGIDPGMLRIESPVVLRGRLSIDLKAGDQLVNGLLPVQPRSKRDERHPEVAEVGTRTGDKLNHQPVSGGHREGTGDGAAKVVKCRGYAEAQGALNRRPGGVLGVAHGGGALGGGGDRLVRGVDHKDVLELHGLGGHLVGRGGDQKQPGRGQGNGYDSVLFS
jgi:hypothetical protein